MFVFTAIALGVPWLFYTRSRYPSSRLHTAFSIVVFLHSLFIIHAIFVSPPSNIFTTLRLPLSAPIEDIRAALLRYTYMGTATQGHELSTLPNATLPEHTEVLLKNLRFLDSRSLYARFVIIR
jgi:hypothetical protein